MAISIRRAGVAAVAELHDGAARTFALACPPGTQQTDIDALVTQHLSAERFTDYLADPGRTVLLAEDDGTAVGYSMLVRGPIADPDVRKVIDEQTTVELSKFYVLADRHGSGVAATLMAATVEAAEATGAATCWLGVNQLNARAARFYDKSGFAVVGTKRFLVGNDWHDDHIRERPLP